MICINIYAFSSYSHEPQAPTSQPQFFMLEMGPCLLMDAYVNSYLNPPPIVLPINLYPIQLIITQPEASKASMQSATSS